VTADDAGVAVIAAKNRTKMYSSAGESAASVKKSAEKQQLRGLLLRYILLLLQPLI